MLALVIIEGIVILLLAVLVAGLLRSHAEILRKLDALGVGDDAPEGISNLAAGISRPRNRTERESQPVAMETITGTTPSGGSASVALSGTRGYTLLAFLSTGCGTCAVFWETFAKGVSFPRHDVRPVIVTRGPERESPAAVAQRAPAEVVTVMSEEAWDAFRVPGTPYFQLVDGTTGVVVGEGSAGSWPRLVQLVGRALADAGHEQGRELRRSTAERLRDSDEELRRAGIVPGDPTLYEKPTGEEP